MPSILEQKWGPKKQVNLFRVFGFHQYLLKIFFAYGAVGVDCITCQAWAFPPMCFCELEKSSPRGLVSRGHYCRHKKIFRGSASSWLMQAGPKTWQEEHEAGYRPPLAPSARHACAVNDPNFTPEQPIKTPTGDVWLSGNSRARSSKD